MKPIVDQWNRFWFAPTPTSTLALLRIAFGFAALAWGVSIAPDSLNFYGSEGVLPDPALPAGQFGLFNAFEGDWVVVAGVGALIAASVATILGYHARLATIVIFVVMLSLRRRNPVVDNSGDNLLRIIGLFLMLAPSGVSLSIDRWRRARDRFWQFPERAPWPVRLIQIQVSVVYLFSVWAKARSDDWLDGTAVFDTLRVGDITRFGIPYAWTDSLLIANVLTYATLVIELALAVLIWNRRARPWVIAAGIALHLFIEATVLVGFFGTAIFVSYVSFIPEDTAARWLDRLRACMGSRSGPLRRLAESTSSLGRAEAS